MIPKSTSRRSILVLGGLGAVTTRYARYVESSWLRFRERECAVPKLTRPLTIGHLSDFHASSVVPNSLIERAIDLAISSKPDIFCLTGDYVTDPTGFDAKWYARVLARLTQQAPVYAVLGNHDGGLWARESGGFRSTAEVKQLLESSGIQVLENRSVKMGEVQLVGVGDYWAGNLYSEKAFREADPAMATVLLSHNPDTKYLFAPYSWELMLCGHTHGGQAVVPLIGWSPAPVEDKHYVDGLKKWSGRWIHVSRGIGSVGGVRFNCRPEVTKLRLIPA